ncbi:GNAT family N-acetyltransferase [Nocardia sp. R7R-8]|uniref:GNAT family N-acetyltransferase n=1 Tax=Nocardia sp. R7R-8 TaxID=3459304 RepID=UPI00403DFC4D
MNVGGSWTDSPATTPIRTSGVCAANSTSLCDPAEGFLESTESADAVVAEQARGHGIGRALTTDAIRRYVPAPGTLEVVTFGPDHPGAGTGGARAFYEHLGFHPAEAADPGPNGGSRQIYRCRV